MRKITAGKYKFPKQYWSSVSDDAKNFITSLLQVNPAQRPTCAEALQHKWLTGNDSAATARPSSPLATFTGAMGFSSQQPAAAQTVQNDRISEEGSRSSSGTSGGEICSDSSNGGGVEVVPLRNEPSTVLSEYQCRLGKRAGQAFISKRFITFVDSKNGTSKKIPITEVVDITKKRKPSAYSSLMKLAMMGSTSCYGTGSVSVVTRDNAIHEFTGLHSKRDDAFSTTIRCGMQQIAYAEANQLGQAPVR